MVAAVVPFAVFQIWLFRKIHVNIFNDDENKVWWRENNLADAGVEEQVLLDSNWPRSRSKARYDYMDAFTTTGWWEEAVTLVEDEVEDEDGNRHLVKGGGWLSEKKCSEATDVLVGEVMLVPALFLRSREGMEAAEKAQDLQKFYSIAKDKLHDVIDHVATSELSKMGVTEPSVVQNWAMSATEILWPGNEDCYRRAIYEGEPPDCVKVSESVKSLLRNSLSTIKGMAATKYADESGSFVNLYRSVYKRYSGNSHFQVHYMSFQILVRFVTAFAVGALSGPYQGLLLLVANGINVAVVAGVRPYKNRLQNFKHLFQCTARTFLILLGFMMLPRPPPFETNEAANEATFVVVLLFCAFVDAVSPTVGSVRSIIGSTFVCLGLQRRAIVLRHKRIAGFVKYCMGQQRNRTSMYLKPGGMKRPYKSWNERRSKKRVKKETQILMKGADEVPEDERYSLLQTGMDDLQDAIALQKWLGVHILPRVVAIAATTTRTFCASHLGCEAALEDLYKSTSMQGFLALCKEHFFKEMNENMLMVLPSVELTAILLTHPYKAQSAVGKALRSGRQPRAPPPWFGPRTRKTARLLLSNIAWKIAESSWNQARFALRGQVLTWKPGTTLDEDLKINPLVGEWGDFEFGVEESQLHTLVKKIELSEIIVTMSKVLPDKLLSEEGGGGVIPVTPRGGDVL